MAGEYIKDLPEFTDLRETDEVLLERVEGDVRTTGRMKIANLIGGIISTPNITDVSQDGTSVTLDGLKFASYAKVKIDGEYFPVEVFPENQIIVDITGLAAGEHSFVVYNAYKASAAVLFTTT